MSSKLGALAGVLVMAASLLVEAAPSQAGAALTLEQQKAVDTAVEAEMKKQEAVGVAVGVIRNGKIAYVRGYGLADREQKSPVTTRTVFNWASNSKPILALLIMLLFGDGRLDLDDDVRKFVPEYAEQKGQTIKVRQLMCHMSGIPHYGKNIVPQKKEHKDKLDFLDPIAALDTFSLSSLQFPPGDKVLYSTFGYILLSAVAQRAGKEPLHDQVTARLTKPLGMTSFQLDLPFKNQPDWAVGYVKKGQEIVKAPDVDHFWKHGGGAYKSNIEDFAKWAEALVSRKLHSKKLEDVMWKAQTTNDGVATTWGLGFTVERLNGRLKVSHGGSQEETKTRLVVYPELGHGVVVMCNSQYSNPNLLVGAVQGAIGVR